MKRRLILAALLVAALVALLPLREIAYRAKDQIAWWVQAGTPDAADVMLPMPDGVRLATDVYLPDRDDPAPTVLMVLPYGKRDYGEVRFWVEKLVPRGFAVVVQDMRGRHGSEGVFAPYPNAASDGVATLDWIAAQPWSNGRVGTLGCSALGEAQLMIGATNHPALRAMVPIAAGGAIGAAKGKNAFFGVFEGGVYNLASGAGWFGSQGGKTAETSGYVEIDPQAVLGHLPLDEVVRLMRPDPTDYEAQLRSFENPEYWRKSGYVTGEESYSAPTLFIDTWHDLGTGSTLALAETLREGGAKVSTIMAPGTHCNYLGTDGDTMVGDLVVAPETSMGYVDLISGFFAQNLDGGPDIALPKLSYYMLTEDRWLEADTWPPAGAQPVVWSLGRDGALGPDGGDANAPPRSFTSDPLDPVPSVGGAICCTGDPEARIGPLFQNPIEGRQDLLLYTSEPLTTPLRIAGPVRAQLRVSADVPDTDLVVRLTDVDDKGNSLMVQEGALRLRYRDGFAAPSLMQPGTVYEVTVDMRDIAYTFRPGHRLRLHIAGTSFPRLERNLNTGRDNYSETEARKASINIHTGSAVRLFALPD